MTRSTRHPGQPDRFRQEHTQAFFDLLALVRPRPSMRVIDLGCGTGDLTQHLHQHLRARETTGMDSSDAMLKKSGHWGIDGLRFEHGDISAFAPTHRFDLLFSNESLHWLDDHPTLFTRLSDCLDNGGQLAVQMPCNFDHPSHQAALEVAGDKPFHKALGGHLGRPPILSPEAYATLLYELGFEHQHVRLEIYAYVLESRDDVVEWMRETFLMDYQKRISEHVYAAFLERYRQRIGELLPDERPFFFPFKRLLIWGQRPY